MFSKTTRIVINNYFSKKTRLLSNETTSRLFSSSATKEETKNSLNFSNEENERILDILNSKPMEILARYNISKSKLNKVEAWKHKNGQFQDVNDILNVDSFSVKIAEKFYKSLLGEEPIMKPIRKIAPFVIPTLSNEQSTEITSSVSINIGVTSVIWSRLELNNDGPCQLTHWECHEINEKKIHLHDLIDRCLYIDYLIPDADCYVFENPQVAQTSAPGNAEQVNINVQRAQLLSILGYAMASRNTLRDQSKPNVFYLKRFLAAKLFQQLIGTERVSAEKTILNLMRTCYNLEDVMHGEEKPDTDAEALSVRGNVHFSAEHRAMYKECEGYSREFLGQALLLNLAFVRLVLLKDPKSTALVMRIPKQSGTK